MGVWAGPVLRAAQVPSPTSSWGHVRWVPGPGAGSETRAQVVGCVVGFVEAAEQHPPSWVIGVFLQNAQELLRQRTSEMSLSGPRGCESKKEVFEITIRSCLYCYFIP